LAREYTLAAVDPVTVSITIDRPREEVFEYLADIANHPQFTDHYLVDWHLTRIESYGRGAGARFRVKAPFGRFNWADATFAEVEPPRRIVEVGRGGKSNRVRTVTVYELSRAPGGTTKVTLASETEPATFADRILESFGARGWLRRKNARALRRLRGILEDGDEGGPRATVAGG
jgi:uncharacterized protein YndB with AHSA1/START domain